MLNNKLYKVRKTLFNSNFRIVNMLPGDLVVAGCFLFFNVGGIC